jgi:hypothetical protein
LDADASGCCAQQGWKKADNERESNKHDFEYAQSKKHVNRVQHLELAAEQ